MFGRIMNDVKYDSTEKLNNNTTIIIIIIITTTIIVFNFSSYSRPSVRILTMEIHEEYFSITFKSFNTQLWPTVTNKPGFERKFFRPIC
jgi:hypothetical protein